MGARTPEYSPITFRAQLGCAYEGRGEGTLSGGPGATMGGGRGPLEAEREDHHRFPLWGGCICELPIWRRRRSPSLAPGRARHKLERNTRPFGPRKKWMLQGLKP